MKEYDLVIIGSGSAATSAAFYCSTSGMRTAIVDYKPFGGTCALRGCDPKKVLYGVSGIPEMVNRMRGKGVTSSDIGVDWREMVKFKRTFTEPMPSSLEKGFDEAGIDHFNSVATFSGKDTLTVDGEDIRGGKILIASGAKASPLKVPGAEHVIDNEAFMELDSLPDHVVFVGGGYISVEFAGIVAASRSRATVIHSRDRLLQSFDGDLVENVQKSLEDAGVELLLEQRVTAIEKSEGGFVVKSSGKSGTVETHADLVVHGAGRVANIDRLKPEIAGIKADVRGIEVNEFMQSVSNRNVYAAGDCAATKGYRLTPIAGIEGDAAAFNIVHGNGRKVVYDATPTVVFSSPPLAMVGLTEEGAKRTGRKVRVSSGDSSTWYNSRRKGIAHSGFKILIDEETSEILGAHILGDNSEEVINIFSLAMRHGIKVEELKNYPFAYPSDTTELRYML